MLDDEPFPQLRGYSRPIASTRAVRSSGSPERSCNLPRSTRLQGALVVDDSRTDDEISIRSSPKENPMTYPYDPNTALDLFHADHRQDMKEARIQRRAKSGRRPVGSVRRWTIVGAAVAVTMFATAAIPANSASTDSRSVAASTCDQGGNYRSGCQLVAGRPDGWYDSTQTVSAPSRSNGSGFLSFK